MAAGLTRDKKMEEAAMQTGMMTGCGSVLWMAPEILTAEKYNEKIDVFSFAMCLVELVDGRLPWSGVCSAAEVPHKVVKKTRPNNQLSKASDSMTAMVQKCWQHNPSRRPTFKAIRLELETEAEARGLECGEQIFIPRTSDTSGGGLDIGGAE
jgi:serine/threonine protein kinase|eukprot:COSAG06_NODE_9_length_37879_cov_13.349735_19_plen_153_part_00